MKLVKRCIGLLLVVCVLFCTYACNGISDYTRMPDGPHMSERIYQKFDEQEAFLLAEEIIELCQSKDNLELVIEKRDEYFAEYYNKLSTLNTLAIINYDKDIFDEYWQEESVWIAVVSQELHTTALEFEKAIFSSPCADYFIEELGQDYADLIFDTNPPSDEQQELLAKIAELESEYMPLYYGTERTIDDMADLLRDLVINRNAYARTVKDGNGEYYDNYLDYAYENLYGREYTPEDSAKYSESMKANLYQLAPELFGYYRKYYTSEHRVVPVTEEQIKVFMPEIIKETVPEMMRSWDYMMDKGLYDFTYSQNKAGRSYVINFSDYGDAFMFINPRNYFLGDLTTVIHEFGHYNQRFMTRDYLEDTSVGRNNDLVETHSQALELLALPAVENICNKHYSSVPGLYKAYAAEFAFNSLWTMLLGCAVDAFEYKIYNANEEELTTAFFRQGFLDLLRYYFPIQSGYEFPDISHIYMQPGYYISYSVSMLFSYVVWASDNPIENYVNVVKHGPYNRISTVCKKTGLDYPLDPNTMEGVAAAISEYASKTFG